MSPHVFVVLGDLAHLSCDGVVIPTDAFFTVEDRWATSLGFAAGTRPDLSSLKPEGWTDGPGYGAARAHSDAGPRTWFIDSTPSSGGTGTREDVAALSTRLRHLLSDIAGSWTDSPGLARAHGRPRPLIAIPTLGVGRGGFGGVRGDVINALLETCADAVARLDIDVVIVAKNPIDYSAFQDRRRTLSGPWRLPDEARRAVAAGVAERARDGSLALFLGAGVSMGAGLPGWGHLLDALTAKVTDPAIRAEINDLESLLDKAELIQATLDSLGTELTHIIGQIKRYSLSHALLASLRCEQAVTTNYDTLYEQALKDALGDHQVFPFDAPRPQTPWLLKMHGDIARTSPIILSRSDFVGYAAAAGPMGAIVQTLLMTKHLLVVGSSMTDDNFLRLAHEVVAFRKVAVAEGAPLPPMGTVVSLGPSKARARLWDGRFEFVNAIPESDASSGLADDSRNAAHAIAVFLDVVGMYASVPLYAADIRYTHLLDSEEEQASAESARDLLTKLRALPGTAQGRWAAVIDTLAASGAERGVPSP